MNSEPNPAPSSDAIAVLSEKTTSLLPPEYLEFMSRCDGGEGFLGDDYAELRRIEELEPFNADYQTAEYLSNTLLIGSDGGVEFVRVPFIGMSDDVFELVGVSFAELVRSVGKRQGSVVAT